MIFGSRMVLSVGGPSSLLNNLVAYWSFDNQNSVDQVLSLTGSDNNITYTTSSKSNYSAEFNTTSSYITIPENNSLKLTAAYTISAWIKPQISTCGIFSVYNTGSTYGYSANVYNGFQSTSVRGSGNTSIGSPNGNSVQLNTWNHCVWTFNNTTISHYTNGESGATLTLANSTFDIAHSAGTKIRIGYDLFSNNIFQGNIDELGVWSRVLHPIEIKRLYNNGTGRFYGSF